MEEFKVPFKTYKETSSGVYEEQKKTFYTVDRMLITALVIAAVCFLITIRLVLKLAGI
jgi:hypothetical protein